MRFLHLKEDKNQFYNLTYLGVLLNQERDKPNKRRLEKLKTLIDPKRARNPTRADYSKFIDFQRKYGLFKIPILSGKFQNGKNIIDN